MNGTHVLAFLLGIGFLLATQIFAALILNKRKPTPKDGPLQDCDAVWEAQMSAQDSAELTADLRKLAAELSVKMQTCTRTGQLSRYVKLSQAREWIYAAIHMPSADERQLTLDVSGE